MTEINRLVARNSLLCDDLRIFFSFLERDGSNRFFLKEVEKKLLTGREKVC
jgi:hypothetical protein